MTPRADKKNSYFILTLKCQDQSGIVAAISTLLFDNHCNIEESAQFSDPDTGIFFMRIRFSSIQFQKTDDISHLFKPIAQRFTMWWDLCMEGRRPRVIIMVSKQDHCLNDLLYRWRIGSLNMDITRVISNHDKCRDLVEREGLTFEHLPITKETKPQQEAQLRASFKEDNVDLIILARYMQILSESLSNDFAGRVINIHHSFLPGFKGARPYHRAHERGVKLIGATAHYVTPDLDEGPIIEQETYRVHHAQNVKELIANGRDVERRVLAHAVKAHIERRVMVNGRKTVML